MTLDQLYKRAYMEGLEIDNVHMRELRAIAFPEGWIAIDYRKFDSETELKCILAHEIGHCETGSFYNVYSPYCLKAQCEHQANKRAAMILMPYRDVVEAIRMGYATIEELADYFEVTIEFAKMSMSIYEDRIRGIDQFDRRSVV